MDVRSGEILAGVSYPDFDPHNPGKYNSASMFNRLSLGVYEMGSVFKIFSTAAFFETVDAGIDRKFDAREPIKRHGFTISDYHPEKRILTLPEVFMYSSNIGAALMGEEIGTEVLKDFYEDIGLTAPLDFAIKEVSRPIIPDPWRDINTLTASYGHGIATTPVQLISAVSSIVNGGLLVRPKLVIDESRKAREIRLVSEDTSENIRRLLRLTVKDGTGSKADVDGYNVGGKTGTAEKIGKKGYDRDRLLSSFIGVFPVEEPRYAVFVMIDEPKGQKASFGYATGGWVATPAVGKVIKSMVSILGIKPHHVPQDRDMAAPLRRYVRAKS